MLRPHTTCGYCGERITGTSTDAPHDPDPAVRRLLRLAMRIACRKHARLALADPNTQLYWDGLTATAGTSRQL